MSREWRVGGPYEATDLWYGYGYWQIEGPTECALSNTGVESYKQAKLLAAAPKLMSMLKRLADEADRVVLAAQDEGRYLNLLTRAIADANILIRKTEREGECLIPLAFWPDRR